MAVSGFAWPNAFKNVRLPSGHCQVNGPLSLSVLVGRTSVQEHGVPPGSLFRKTRLPGAHRVPCTDVPTDKYETVREARFTWQWRRVVAPFLNAIRPGETTHRHRRVCCRAQLASGILGRFAWSPTEKSHLKIVSC